MNNLITNSKAKKIFFCGQIADNSMASWQRSSALTELGHQLIKFDDSEYHRLTFGRIILRKLTSNYAFSPQIVQQFNQDFLNAIISANPEIAWIEKALLLKPDTLYQAKAQLPNCIFISHQEDDPFGLNIQEQPFWKNYIDAIPCYDVHFVVRECNVDEYLSRGAKQAYLLSRGFYPKIFHPIGKPNEYLHDVTFVGNPRDRRINDISILISKLKIAVEVFGNRWNRTLVYYTNRKLFHPAVLASDYVNVLWRSKICLGFLSVNNRDQSTMRTFEIPATGAFFLAQRTPEHQKFFEEDKEAVYFDSMEECADKIKYYLKHDSEREKIAAAGYQRCINSGYSMHDRLSTALKKVMS